MSERHLTMDDLEKAREVLMNYPMRANVPLVHIPSEWQDELSAAIESKDREAYTKIAKKVNQHVYVQGGPEKWIQEEL